MSSQSMGSVEAGQLSGEMLAHSLEESLNENLQGQTQGPVQLAILSEIQVSLLLLCVIFNDILAIGDASEISYSSYTTPDSAKVQGTLPRVKKALSKTDSKSNSQTSTLKRDRSKRISGKNLPSGHFIIFKLKFSKKIIIFSQY